jgi:hypothetical protein
MGYATKGNHSLTSNTIHKVLVLLKQEAEVEPPPIAREYLKVCMAIALATCASLRGPKVLLLDVAGLRWNIDKGKNGSIPQSLLKVGVNLTEAPHVIAVLLENFKGRTGVQHHMIALASMTRSGIALRWWLEELINVRVEEGCSHGSAFGYANGLVATLHKYNGILHHFLQLVQQENPELIAEDNDVQGNYSFF